MSRYLVIALDAECPFVQVVDDDTIRRFMADHDRHVAEVELQAKYEREDPETGAPLPPGVVGFHVGRR